MEMYKWIFFLLFIANSGIAQTYDILIKNGKIIDGTGNSWYYSDIAIQNGIVQKPLMPPD
jgi:N-acyl-D-amino-acid deacylase